MQDIRGQVRRSKNVRYALTWRAEDGSPCSAEGRGLDISPSGVGLECASELELETVVNVKASDASVAGDCFVAHCTRRGQKYHIGLEFTEKAKPQPSIPVTPKNSNTPEPDYYDVLQISPKADTETVHRVFRIMAARFHPDNPETGDQEEFLRLKQAYDVLSDPILRGQYDGMRDAAEAGPMPIFELKDFVTGVQAEANRRLGVLSILYNKRRMDPDKPGVSLLDLEKQMGFPREYLCFTMWYLRSKEFVVAADNSDYALTAAGVDHVESNVSENEILAKLLKPSSAREHPVSTPTHGRHEAPNRPVPRYLPEASASPH